MTATTETIPEDFDIKNVQHQALLKNLEALHIFDAFDTVADLTEAISLNHGFGKKWNEYVNFLGFEEAVNLFVCKAAALQHTEVSETVEEARLQDRNFAHMVEEQSDVIIRCINLCNLLLREAKVHGLIDESLTLGEIIKSKTEKNIARPYGHGSKRF